MNVPVLNRFVEWKCKAVMIRQVGIIRHTPNYNRQKRHRTRKQRQRGRAETFYQRCHRG
jgi:hypothetical protein